MILNVQPSLQEVQPKLLRKFTPDSWSGRMKIERGMSGLVEYSEGKDSGRGIRVWFDSMVFDSLRNGRVDGLKGQEDFVLVGMVQI